MQFSVFVKRAAAPTALFLATTAVLTACSSMDPMGVLPAFADELAPVRTIDGARLRVATVDLSDPQTVVDIGLADGAQRPNQTGYSVGAEDFESMVRRAKPAIAVNGTFFSESGNKAVMGDVVRAGHLVKFSPWEDRGTTFILHAGNRPEMVTERAQGSPDRTTHWLSLTAGPRLLRDGVVYLHPKEEGFHDPDVFGTATRTALGFTREGGKLLLVTFLTPVSLQQEARVMKDLGTYQAMNLDGGTSQALAVGNRTLISPGRHLTNILAVYDRHHPAPTMLAGALKTFDMGHPDPVMLAGGAARPGDRWLGKLKPGQTLSYGGLRFAPKAGEPVVGVLDGRLAFSEGNFGQIYAAWPKPRQRYSLAFDARLVDEHMTVALGNDVSLEVRRAAPAGLFLRKGGAIVDRNPAYVPDRRWHHYSLVDDGTHLRVLVDGRSTPAIACPAQGPGCGLGLSGRAEYRGIKVAGL